MSGKLEVVNRTYTLKMDPGMSSKYMLDWYYLLELANRMKPTKEKKMM